jgi:hypothetical protein
VSAAAHPGTLEDALHEQASAQAGGRSDFGDDRYLQGLRTFLHALTEDYGLEGDVLRAAAEQPVTKSLVGRLYAFDGFGRRPEYARAAIDRPLFIIGLGRTGTTALHQLLALDEQFQGLQSWLVQTPMVRPPRDQWASIPEHEQAVAAAEAVRDELSAMHWVSADDYDEDQQVIGHTFFSNRFGSQRSPLPTYDDWLLGQDLTPSFRYLRDVLALIGLDSPPRTWLLKNPSHILTPDALLGAFPDARVVVTHRDPVKSIPSVASLIWTTRQRTARYGSVRLGTAEGVGRREMRFWTHALDRYMKVSAERPDAFLDVWQHDLHADPLAVVQRIYERFGLELSPQAEGRMREWAAEQGGRDAGGHRYTAEEFGLTDREIAETYATYRERYGFAA